MARAYEPVIGIDLGTTYSVVGLFTSSGEVKILDDGYGEEKFTVPSVVAFLPENFATAVGRAAYQAAKDSNDITLIYDVKRLIGKYPGHHEI